MSTLFRHVISAFCLLLVSTSAGAVTEISIKAARIEHPLGDAQDVNLQFNLNKRLPTLSLTAKLKQKNENDFTQLSIRCDVPQFIEFNAFKCSEGLLKNTRINLPFSLEISRLFSHGAPDIKAALQLKNANFSDEAGLHAAEKLSGNVAITLKQTGQVWEWNAALDWQLGEVFWQPFYLANGGHTLVANGSFEGDVLTVKTAHLKIKSVGELVAGGQVQLTDFKLINLNANLPDLNLNTAYPLLFKPLLQKTAFNDVEIEGKATLSLQMINSELKLFELRLKDVDLADRNQKFALYKLNANFPWSFDSPKNVSLNYESGELLNLPLGKTNIQAEVNRYSLISPNVRLPILDGALRLSDISAARIGGQWYWHLSAKLEPISMADFSTQLNLPKMQGKASAEIPLVTYSAGMLTTDGSVVLHVFNGSATVTQLRIQSPLGIAPKLNADIALRNLDLGDLTRTFSFGAIEGKLDGDIEGLELQNWTPVRFDAMVQSSPGKYPKKISQRAVENISALGGGGAAAAVQRSFLRFFEQFNYGKMGLSCQLRNDICEMGGIESTPHGYVIVKGSGIPAITVMGYNRTVGWSELLARIKRVTDGNSKAIIK
ncbi:MAG: hypothetical protein Q8S46_07550 [Methylotenera sp.]|nr:hypothetical protein [Methylotenera sp.]MDP3303991.1 hypothetical protein [Methylotenera sp.]